MAELRRIHGPQTLSEHLHDLAVQALWAIVRDQNETPERRNKARRAIMHDTSSGPMAARPVLTPSTAVLGNHRGGAFLASTIEYRGDSSGR